jgi:[acyl-carrier-protein] S-malonyltransferase
LTDTDTRLVFVFSGQGGLNNNTIQQIAGNCDQILESVKRDAIKGLGQVTAKNFFKDDIANDNMDCNRQCAVLAAGILSYRIALEAGAKPDMVAGHSLGEYAALVASGVLDPAEAFKIVYRRGLIVQRASLDIKAAMIAIAGGREVAESACKQTRQELGQVVEVACVNSPTQTVIAGHTMAAVSAGLQATQLGAPRIKELPVNRALHTSLMQNASDQMLKCLREMRFKDSFEIPFYSSVTGKRVIDPAELKDILAKQLSCPVLWIDTVHEMLTSGATEFCEVGSGTSLKGFCRKIQKTCRICGKNEGKLRKYNGAPCGVQCDQCFGTTETELK